MFKVAPTYATEIFRMFSETLSPYRQGTSMLLKYFKHGDTDVAWKLVVSW